MTGIAERKLIRRVMDNWVSRRLDRSSEFHIAPARLKAKSYEQRDVFELPQDEIISADAVSADYWKVEITISRNFPTHQHAPLRFFLHARHADFVTNSAGLVSMEAEGYRRMLEREPEKVMWDFYCHLLKKVMQIDAA
jgi:hypothetical protein